MEKKRIIAAILAGLMLLSLAACGGGIYTSAMKGLDATVNMVLTDIKDGTITISDDISAMPSVSIKVTEYGSIK